MCKSEIFAKIINIVSKETEVSVDQILSSDKNMETVDARYLLCISSFRKWHVPFTDSRSYSQNQTCSQLHDI